MRKTRLIFLLILVIVIVIGLFNIFKYKVNKDLNQPVNTPTIAPTPTSAEVKPKSVSELSLFVPYWGLSDEKIEPGRYEKIIYFGISPKMDGESQLGSFNEIVPEGTDKLLAVRMINNDENFAILDDPSQQEKVIQQSIEVAKGNNMQGIVLDLEISAIPFDSLVKQINSFTQDFYKTAKDSELSFYITLYGDALYRARPFDVKVLSQNADHIMIMAYDFSKARGNPGPNFPLGGNERFGYDYGEMTDDFLQFAPPEKISVIFGLFGYDWVVDEKGNALEQGKAMTLLQVKQKLIDNCEFSKCEWRIDKDSFETVVSYTDLDGKEHIVWFEDMESVKEKQEFLKRKGINSFSYWAYSYF